MAATQAPTLKSALLSGKAGLLQSLQRLTLDPNYVPARLPEGMVVGIWGDAVVRTPDGTVRELKVGEMVRKGYVILTSQNGIVQLEAEGDRLARVPVDRDGLEPTGTGLSGGEDGSLNGAERVGRVIEVVSPADFDFSAAERASNAAASVTGTGLAAPVASVADVTVKEDAGHAVFTVTLARSSDSATTLGLALTDGTAQGGGIDYGTAGTPQNLEVSLDNGATWTPATSVTIPAGMQSALVRTPITSDSTYEPDEGFTLTTTLLAGNVNVADPVGVATIVDQLPYIQAVNPVTVNEGAGQAVFTVTLSNASKEPVTVRYTTADGTATGGADYTPVTGLITFAPGETSKTIAVPILNDTVYEGDETFKLTLSEPVNAGLPTPDVLGTIQDDGRGTGGTDDDRPRVGTVSSPAAREGEPLDFTITLTTTSTTPTVLDVTPRSGSGTVGTDTGPLEVSFDGGKTFTTVTDGKVTVPPGTDTLIVRVPTLPDSDPETSETIFLDVKAPADPAPVYGTGTIEDVPLVSIAGPAAVDEAIGNATYTVTLNHAATVPVSVTVKTVEGVALAGSDYTAVNQVLTFAPGETSKTVLVPITNDDVLEGKEAFTVQLAAPAGTVIDTAHSSVLTEIADDGLLDDGVNKDAPKLAVTDLNLPETSGFAVFNVTLDKASGLATTVALALADGTAKGGGVDYGSAGAGNLQVSTDGGTTWTDATTATFAAGKTSVLVRTPLVADALDDSGETFTLKATTTAPADGTSNASATGTATVYDLPTLRIDDQTVNEATGTATFTVTLSSASSTAVTVRYASVNDTATSGSDYDAVSGTLTFAPGELTRTISVPITDDLVYEGAETFKIQLTSPSVNALIADDTGIGTIMDDGTGTVPPGVTPTDDRPRATINDVIVNEGAGTATFTVTLAGTATTPITLGFATSDGTAKAGLDYSATTGTLTFAPGETSKSITVPILNDTVYEGSETFDVTLNNPSSNVVLGDPLGLGTIKDDGTGPVPPGVTPDDDRPLVTINDVQVNEAASKASFTVTLSNPSDLPVTVKYSSVNGTAEAGFDYDAVLGTLTFAPGELSKTIDVPLKNDTVYEGAETFQIVLTDPTNATVTAAGAGVDSTKDGTGVGTILDDGTGPVPPGVTPDNDTPAASINDVVVNEAAGTATFTVTLTNAAKMPVTVDYASADGTATAGQDYAAVASTLTFAPGETSKTITVPILNDTVYEGSETFTINLSAPANATITDGIGLGTIKDDGTGPVPPGVTPDNDTPAASINDVVVNEAAGTATFTVTLTNAAKMPVTVDYASADGTATAGQDYAAVASTLTFAPGETSKTITVPILNDTVYEGSETFTINLSAPANATITDGIGLGTIKDDGTGPVPPGVTPDNDTPAASINDVVVNEAAGTATFTVTLTNAAKMPVTIAYASADGTATAGLDYTAVADTLTFAPGQTSQTITVDIRNDIVYEGSETFTINLSAPANATIADGIGLGTIKDDGTGPVPPGVTPDNDTPAASINDVVVNEAAGTATFTVTLTNAAKMPVTVDYASADGTAKAGLDYSVVPGTLTFDPGQTSKTITVSILNDNVYEGAETFTINLSAPTNATIADGIGLGTIKDDGTGPVPPGVTPDNDTPLLTIDSPIVVENLAGAHVVFTLTLGNPSAVATTVSLALTDGTAKGAGVDYGSTGSNNLQVSTDGGTTWLDATSATFAPNITTLLVRTPLNNDKAIEPSEAFTLTATTTAGATLSPTATGTGNIADDDVAPIANPDTGRGDEDTPITGSVLTNDTDANGDPLTVTGFSVGGTPYVPGTTATIPGVGTITIAPTGVYTFNPLPNYDGPVPVITYTVTDSANPVNGTLTLTINPVNDAPIVTAGAVTPLSEEGLTGGLADTTGNVDTTNLVVNTGQIGLSDVEGSPMTVVWSPVTANYTQNGIGISWTGQGTQTLVGRADSGPEILTATIDNTGAYTVKLLGQIDHPSAGEDSLQLDFGVVVSDGVLSSPGTVSVRIEDDSPAALVTQTSSVKLQDTNLLITLDTSGSMLTNIETGVLAGQTRLDVAKAAINNLMEAYSEFGSVRVRLVSFANAATDQGNAWLTLAQAKLVLDAISTVNGIPGGITNYDVAIAAATAAFGTAGSLPAAQTVAYFLSDGNPNRPAGSEGMNPSEESSWKTFLNTNNITSYAIGIADGVGQSKLDPVAWNGTTTGGSEANAVVVTDLAQLSAVLKNTVPIPSGDLSAGGTFRAGGQVGADKGNVQSVTVDGVTYAYDTANSSSNPITVSGGTGHYAYVLATKTLVVTTSAGGKFYIDLDDGSYEYRVPASLAMATQTEVLSYVVADKDGDTQHAQIVVNVGTSTSSVVNSENVPTATHVGNSSDDILVGSAGNDYMIGGDGNDNLSGLLGNDALFGGWGNDTLVGGDGNDTLTGGQGNDVLTGGVGSDVFAWTLSDQGTSGAPAVDTITDFNTSLPADGGDIIDLRDLLAGENTSTLQNYLEFTFSGSGSTASTTIHVSANGSFTGGTYSAAAEDQAIVLTGVDLRTSLGLDTAATDADIISKMLTQGKLIVDP